MIRKLLVDATFSSFAAIIGVGGFIFTTLPWYFESTQTVDLRALTAICAILLYIIAVLSYALRAAASMRSTFSARVQKVALPFPPHKAAQCMFQLKISAPLPSGNAIQFVWIDKDGWSRNLGVGTILQKLENGNVLAALDHLDSDEQGADGIVKLLLADNAGTKESIRIIDGVQIRDRLFPREKGEQKKIGHGGQDRERKAVQAPDETSSDKPSAGGSE